MPILRFYSRVIYFYPRSPCGERLGIMLIEPDRQSISIHALLAESDSIRHIFFWFSCNFYPRSPCGERRMLSFGFFSHCRFLSTLSLRRATRHIQRFHYLLDHFYPRSPCGERRRSQQAALHPADFYPRSPCGERLDDILAGVNELLISIHALLAESDNADSPTQWTAT